MPEKEIPPFYGGIYSLSAKLFTFRFQEQGGGDAEKLFEGLAEMVDIRKVEHLRDLANGVILLRE